MRLMALVPTTNGPIVVKHIRNLEVLPRSQVLLGSEYLQAGELGIFSNRYNALISPGGPVGNSLNVVGQRFELSISELPSSGRSWELPIGLVHWCISQEHTLVDESPDFILWATGELSGDGKVVVQDYELDAKFRTTIEYLQANALRDVPGCLFLPSGAQTPGENLVFQGEMSKQFEVATFDDAVAQVDGYLAETLQSGASNEARIDRYGTSSKTKRMSALVFAWGGVSVLATTLLLAGFVSISETPGAAPHLEPMVSGNDLAVTTTGARLPENLLDPAEQQGLVVEQPSFVLTEIRASEGSSCIEILFSGSDAVEIELAPVAHRFAPIQIEGLCAIEFSVAVSHDAVELALDPSFRTQVLDSDWAPTLPLDPGEVRVFYLRARVDSGTYWISADEQSEVRYEFELIGG